MKFVKASKNFSIPLEKGVVCKTNNKRVIFFVAVDSFTRFYFQSVCSQDSEEITQIIVYFSIFCKGHSVKIQTEV